MAPPRVALAEADPGVQDAIDAAHHAKYDAYGSAIVGTVVRPAAHQVTPSRPQPEES